MKRKSRRFFILATIFFVLYLLFVGLNVSRLMQISVDKENKDCESVHWDRSVSLNSNHDFVIKWKLDEEENIAIMISAKTTGWLSVGFSPNGKMAGADIVMGWIHNNKVYLQDRFAVDNSYPHLDETQNYYLIDGKENKTHTVICFWRQLNTCDKEDFRFKNGTVRVIWAFHNEDPNDDSINSPRFHGNNKGSKSLYFLDANLPKPSEENLAIHDIKMNELALPNDTDTMYACTFWKFPDIQNQYHFIGYEPLFQEENKRLIHHMLLHACHGRNIAEKVSKINPHGENCHAKHFKDSFNLTDCFELVVAWTEGSEGEFYPKEVGYLIDASAVDHFYFKLEIHYHNEPFIKGIVDNSGMRIYLTKELRSYNAGMFVFAIPSSPSLIIPPKQRAFTGRAMCFPECTQGSIPPEGIDFFAIFLHAHVTGTAISLRLVRNGIEYDILTDDNWDHTHEQSWFTKKSFKILPNDMLILDCTYNTENRALTTFGGAAKYNEMCRAFIQYYPKKPFFIYCQSEITLQYIDPLVEFHSSSLNFTEVGKSRLQHIFNLKWEEKQVKALQDLYYKGPHLMRCSGVPAKEAVLPNFLPMVDKINC